MGENEMTLAVSYYRLFKKIGDPAPERRRSADTNAPIAKYGDTELSSSDGFEFWEEDEWDEQDEADARKLLSANREKCAIPEWEMATGEDADTDAWNKFYTSHGSRFFNDRHYLPKAFPKEFGTSQSTSRDKTLVEIGCGPGALLLPLMEDTTSHEANENPWKTFHGIDLSSVAIDLLTKDSRFTSYNQSVNGASNSGAMSDKGGAFGHVCNISQSLPEACTGVADVTSLLFCLSAVDPDQMHNAAKNVALSLRPGGIIVFRDYGLYDEAQLKLGTSIRKQLKDGFYQKHDGTKCYYFTLDMVRDLFETAGLKVLELKYLRRAYTNKSTGERRRRVWVQGRFQKPQ